MSTATTMKKTRILSPQVGEPAERMWSNCLRIDDLIFVSGLTARGLDGQTIEGENEAEQCHTIFTKIKNLVEEAGATMDDVVKMTIYVTNMAENHQVWKVRQEYFTGNFPACTLVEVSALAKPEILVEIEAIAIAGSSSS